MNTSFDSLLRVDVILEAKKQLIQNIGSILENFNNIDPYVQGVLILGAINLSPSEFRNISSEYGRLIDKAKSSDDEWVRRIANEYSQYPNIPFQRPFLPPAALTNPTRRCLQCFTLYQSLLPYHNPSNSYTVFISSISSSYFHRA